MPSWRPVYSTPALAHVLALARAGVVNANISAGDLAGVQAGQRRISASVKLLTGAQLLYLGNYGQLGATVQSGGMRRPDHST
jgi:hypothetical protein